MLVNLEKEVVFIGFCNDAELSYLYQRATALVFPSTVESFGFPVLEAMACDIPVITSNFGGPSETGRGGAAVLVDPKRAESIFHGMLKIFEDKIFRNKTVALGRARIKEYSWHKTAQKTLVLVNSL